MRRSPLSDLLAGKATGNDLSFLSLGPPLPKFETWLAPLAISDSEALPAQAVRFGKPAMSIRGCSQA